MQIQYKRINVASVRSTLFTGRVVVVVVVAVCGSNCASVAWLFCSVTIHVLVNKLRASGCRRAELSDSECPAQSVVSRAGNVRWCVRRELEVSQGWAA